jgi:hypothetical protein
MVGPQRPVPLDGVERVISFRMQSVVILSKHQPGNKLEREELALMNVSGKL